MDSLNHTCEFLGASPDGLVGDDALVEVKCPYRGRHKKIEPNEDFQFLKTAENGERMLKRNHNYFYQVMGQLAISQRKTCYFVVYTFEDMFIEKIEYDSKLFLIHMLPTLQSFYYDVYRPFVAKTL